MLVVPYVYLIQLTRKECEYSDIPREKTADDGRHLLFGYVGGMRAKEYDSKLVSQKLHEGLQDP